MEKWLFETESLVFGLPAMNCYANKAIEAEMMQSHVSKHAILRLHLMNLTCVDIFYNALNENIKILRKIQPIVSKRNKFLHWIFRYLKNATIDEIEESAIDTDGKKKLIQDVNNVHSFFAFYDFNNVTVFEMAKRAYEEKYHTMKENLEKSEANSEDIEKLLRFCAIDASIKILENYVDFHDIRFIFQAVVANPSSDAFQYLNTNHVTVLTRTDPSQPKKALADTLFVTAHEIIHKLYPFGSGVLYEFYDDAMECAAKSVQFLGNSDSVKPMTSDWFNETIVYEDIVNIIALRMLMKKAEEFSSSKNHLKSILKTLIGGLCKQGKRKNEPIPFHNPLETSLNNAVRQYPLFSMLYQCKKGNRMYAEKEEVCQPLGKKLIVKDYEWENNGTSSLDFFDDLLKTSKTMNFSFIFL